MVQRLSVHWSTTRAPPLELGTTIMQSDRLNNSSVELKALRNCAQLKPALKSFINTGNCSNPTACQHRVLNNTSPYIYIYGTAR